MTTGLGARMTGGGFGGCAVALVRGEKTARFVEEITRRYEAVSDNEGASGPVHAEQRTGPDAGGFKPLLQDLLIGPDFGFALHIHKPIPEQPALGRGQKLGLQLLTLGFVDFLRPLPSLLQLKNIKFVADSHRFPGQRILQRQGKGLHNDLGRNTVSRGGTFQIT
ncbi:MAG: hypothetical protein GWP11_02570, partial [Proteobacteria bacterium]|nr:hypothetical protein [Pseudomonadota bacterium]